MLFVFLPRFFFLSFIIYLSIYLASDRVKGDTEREKEREQERGRGREDRAFVLLLSAVSIICDLVKQKIKRKNRRKRKNERSNMETNNNNNNNNNNNRLHHPYIQWLGSKKNRKNTTDLTKWSDCEPRPHLFDILLSFFCFFLNISACVYTV